MDEVESQTKEASREEKNSSVRNLYEPRIHAARNRFAENHAMSVLLAPDVDSRLLELFLIHFSALGVATSKPVEGWLQMAGERCERIGLTDLGRSLRLHSKHEAGHYLMFMEDTRTLVTHWNARGGPLLDADLILSQPVTDGVRQYWKLHEDFIASDTPFCQLAIQYEIEGLSVRFGPLFMNQCVGVLGSTVMAGMSFVQEHVSLDIGHTHFNEQLLNRLLKEHSEYVTPLVSAGKNALDVYSTFLNDCLGLAKAQIRRAA